MKSCRNWIINRFLPALLIFSILGTSAPAQAIDLGASSDYLIRVTPEAKAAIEKTVGQYGGKINNRYQYVFDGFLVRLPDVAANLIKRIPTVLTIEKDAPIELSAIQNNQSPTPSWGLDRIDQRQPISGTSNFGYRSAGVGATVYIVDTGVSPHNDFGGRLSTSGFSAISDGNGPTDCNGHGTHVAGTVAGTQYGIAKNAKIVPVRVLGCDGRGMFSQVIAGMEWILSPENPNPKTQSVVNMSLGGSASGTIDAAVTKLTNSGIVVVVAAGNDNNNACLKSPARAPSAITVGATTSLDAKASFSNYGSCVDIHAPGSGITSAWIGSLSDSRTISGTSMASPHVAGAAAVFVGLNAAASVAQVTQFLDEQSTRDVITGLPADTVNELLYVSPTDGAPAIVPPVIALRSVGDITHESAVVTTDVNPGFAPTNISLEYSKDSTFATGINLASFTPSVISGGEVVQAVAKLSLLTASTTYYFRIAGVNESGITIAPVGNFKTMAPPKDKPTPFALTPTSITAYSATLQGSVNPGNDSTQVSFVYGTDSEFKINTNTGLAIPSTISGGNPIGVSLPISFLQGGITYYVKVVSSNSSGSVSSDVITFLTPKSLGKPPIVSTKPNGYLFSTSKTNPVQGVVNPQGQTTIVTLVYGPEKSLTSSAKTIVVGTFTGDSDINVTGDIPPASPPGGRIWYRFDASNASGLTKSTPSSNGIEPLAPIITSQRVDNSKAGQAVLWANGNANGSNTRWSFIYGKNPTLYSFASNGSFVLEPGAIEVKASPEAKAVAGNFTTSAVVSGLDNGTTYYYVVKVTSIGYADPARAKPVIGSVGSWSTLNVGVNPTPTPTSTPTATPTPTPTPTPSPTPTPTPGVKLTQTISFPALANRFFNDVGTPLLATSSSGLPITYTNNSVAQCQLLNLGSGKFSIQPKYPLTGADLVSCSFTASQLGNDKYLAATPVTQSIQFSRQSTRINLITPNSLPLTGGYLLANVITTEGRVASNSKDISFTTTTPDVCSVSEYTMEDARGPRVTLRPRANGSCSISVSFSGNGDMKPAATSWSFVVSGINAPAPGSNTAQTIDFPVLSDRQVGVAQPLLAKSTSGLQISYISMTPDICVLLYPASGPSIQTVNTRPDGNEWTCIVRANQTGDDRFAAAAPVDRSFRYFKAPMQLVVENSPTLNGFGPHAIVTRVRLTNVAAMGGLTSLGHLLTAQSLTPTVCRIDSHGTWDRTGGIVNRTYVTGLSNGTCSLKFDFAGTKDRAPATLTWNATITVPVDTPTYVDAQIGGVSIPSTGYSISRANYSGGLVTLDLSVKAKDSKLGPVSYGGRISTSAAPMKVMFLTPGVCSMRSSSNVSGNIFRVVLQLRSEGACNLQVNYPGETRYKYFPAVLTLNATIKP